MSWLHTWLLRTGRSVHHTNAWASNLASLIERFFREFCNLTFGIFHFAIRPSAPAAQPVLPSGLKLTTLNPLSEIRRHLCPRSVDRSVPLGPTATNPISFPDTYCATQLRNPVGGTRGLGVAQVEPPLLVKA